MELSCLLETTRHVPQEKFPRKPYNNFSVDQACSVKMAGYSWVAREVIIFQNPKLKKHQSYHLHQAREGVNLYMSVNNFSAQEHALSKNGHLLNFRVLAVRDTKL